MQQAILNVITTRRSVRNFDDAPVTEEQIRTILRAGMFAPSAHNTRAWQFVTVSDKAMLRQLAGLHRFWKPLAGATLGIACIGHYKTGQETDQAYALFLQQGVSAAIENMLLMIHALGLGAVWLNCDRDRPQYEPCMRLLRIPDTATLMAMLAVGHPATELGPRAEPLDRYEEQKWHKEYWHPEQLGEE